MTIISKLYCDTARPSAFSALQKKGKEMPGVKQKSVDVIRAWLEKKDAYSLHRPVRKRFARNPYTVTKFDVCVGMRSVGCTGLRKSNDNYR